MHRFLVAVTVVSCAIPAVHAAEAKKPNVVVILSDGCGFNEFSMNGSKLFDTPRIDSIATSGVQFKTGYTSGTVCSPTRAGLLTGRYQNRFGHEFDIPPVYSKTNGLSLEDKTIADALKGRSGLSPACLHNLKNDIGEATDLSAKHPDKVNALQAAWDAWDKSNVAPLWGGDVVK